MLAYLRENTLFCLSLLLCVAIVLLVPQISGVMLQTIEMPKIPARDLAAGDADAESRGPLFASYQKSTIEAAGFLAFLSFLFAGSLAGVRWVLPTSWFNSPVAVPIPVAPVPGVRRTALAVLGLLALPILVLLPLPEWMGTAGRVPAGLILLIMVFLLYPLQCWTVDRLCRAFYAAAGRPAWARRRGWGLVIAGLGIAALVCSYFVGPFERLYLQGDYLLPLVGAGFLLFGLWWVAPPGPIHVSFGRLLAWLLMSFAFGEAVWLGAEVRPLSDWVSYRLYTIWAVLQILVLVVEVAAFLDILERNTGAPCRVLGVAALIVVFFVSGVPNPESLRDLERSPAAPEAGGDEWAGHLLRRIEALPENGPVVFVAASGGGSRAAIFAGLVLEALSRTPFGDEAGKTWGDHVVLVSGVSGGSLGSARYIHSLRADWAAMRKANRRRVLMNSVRAELASRMASEAQRLSEAVGPDVPKSDQAEAVRRFCEWFRDHAFVKDLDALTLPKDVPDLRWVLHSGIMDDLCTDFMAPVLRGVLTPVFSRGETLRRFWTGKFGWADSTDRAGYSVDRHPPDYGPDRCPLALYNTGDIRRGCRVAVGFPPLPQKFLRTPPPDEGRHSGAGDLQRDPPETLADLDPKCTLRLADAVGLSANFPFGFNALQFRRWRSVDPDAPDKIVEFDRNTKPGDDTPEGRAMKKLMLADDLDAKLIDGGVVDNTGIDSLFLVVESLRQKANAAANLPGNVYTKIWTQLLERQVFLVEIDSGAKPDKPGFATRYDSVLFDPLAALNNAGFTNAARDKHHYVAQLDARLTSGADFSDRLSRLVAGRENRSNEEKASEQKLLDLQRGGVRRFYHTRFDANHFDEANVLTAWSLSPSDKALLIARFLLELQFREGELRELAVKTAKVSLKQQRAAVGRDADVIFEAGMKARAAAELQEGLEDLAKKMTAFVMDVRGKKQPAAALKKTLETLKTQLDRTRKQVAAAKITDPKVGARLDEIQKAVDEAGAALARTAPVPQPVLTTLTLSPKSGLGTLLADLPGRRKQDYRASMRDFVPHDKTTEIQQKINKNNRDIRRLFDRPAPK